MPSKKAAAKKARPKAESKSETTTISFRLDEEQLRMLEDEATEYGITAHQLARKLTLDALEKKDITQLRERVIEVKEEVLRLGVEMAEVLEWLAKNVQTK